MQRRHLLKSVIAGVVLMASSFVVLAQQPNEYQIVKPQQPGGVNGQIEVIEFFSYGCPHCGEFDPVLTKWRAEQAKDVVFKRVPVSFGHAEWDALGRVYLTLNALGLSDKLDSAVFKAVHSDHIQFADEKARNEWLTKQGVDLKLFDNTLRSFSVQTQAKRAEQLINIYKVEGVPSMAVNGKYMVEGGDPRSLITVSKLVAKERGMRAPAPAPVAASAPAKPAAKKPAKK